MGYLKTFDLAMKDYLTTGVQLDQVLYSHVDTALRLRATNLSSGRSVFPFVSYYTVLVEATKERRNMAWMQRGRSIVFKGAYNEDVLMRRTIPVDIHYQVDIWSNNREELNERMYNLLWHISDTGTMTVDVSENMVQQKYHLFLKDQLDNTDIQSEFETGRIYRHTMNIIVQAELPHEDWIKTVLTINKTIEILKQTDPWP